MRPPPACLVPTQSLSQALPVLLETELRNVPVVDGPATFRLVGAVGRSEVLGLLAEAINARSG
jgi:CBS domain-containing protein